MDGFTKTPKMQCFKSGGSVQKQVKDFTRRDRKMVDPDIAQDKKIVKKAISMHDVQQHEEKTDLTGLKKGGRAKKATGTVKKYASGGVTVSAPYDTKYQDKTTKEWIPTGKKTGGKVENQYAAKKTDKDIKDIANTKRQKPAMLCGGGKMGKYAEGGSIIDTLKAAGTKLKENVMGTPEQNRVAQEQMNKQAKEGSKLAKFFGGKADTESAPAKKCGGKVKKMNTGGTAS